MDMLFLKPRQGLIVRDPVTRRPLPAQGATKPDTAYWRRRIKDGDVEKTSPPAKKAANKGGKAE